MIKNNKSFLKKIISVLLMCLCINVLFIGCKNKVSNKETTKEKKVTEESDKSKNNEDTKETNNSKKPSKITIEKKEFDSKNSKEKEDIKWQESKNNKFSAAIKGRGNNGEEEGVGTICVKDKENKIWNIKVKNDKQDTPKNLLWLDDENILVVIGHAYGTVSKGGDLYNINVKTNKISEIYKRKDLKKEVVSVKKEDEFLVLNMNVFEDDNFSKSHKEEIKMSYKEIKEIISKNN